MKSKIRKLFVATLVTANLVAVLLVYAPAGLARRGESVFDQLDLLVDIRHEIVRNYVEEPDEREMIESAVRAMVDSLKDRYTIFLTPEELEPFDKQIRGSFSGIGAEIDIHENRLRIVSPLEESPAWQAGVMAGDMVLEIEGESTEGIKITEAVKKLTGPEGTQVTIKVRHESGEEAMITITRAQINVRTVKGLLRGVDQHWDYMLDPVNRIGYIRMTQFTGSTADDVREALDQLLAQKVEGLILDLRFNPGGLLESAVAVSDMFLDEGKRIVSVKGRRVMERVESATQEGTIAPVPMVVLANEASASASEIVTGALSDNGRAKFVGTRTFGKGSVQQVKMLESGQGALKITNAYYYLPNGRNIHRREDDEVWGVDPDDGFYVPMNSDQVRDMIKTRRESDIVRARGDQAGVPEQITPQWVQEHLADPQLAAALKALQGKLIDGDWPVVGQSGAAELVRKSKRESLVRQRELINERLDEIQKELTELDQKTSPATDEEENIAQEDQDAPADASSPVEAALPDIAPADDASTPPITEEPSPSPKLETDPNSSESEGTPDSEEEIDILNLEDWVPPVDDDASEPAEPVLP